MSLIFGVLRALLSKVPWIRKLYFGMSMICERLLEWFCGIIRCSAGMMDHVEKKGTCSVRSFLAG